MHNGWQYMLPKWEEYKVIEGIQYNFSDYVRLIYYVR